MKELGLPKGTEKSLLAKFENALKKLDDGNVNNDQAAINVLRAFINKVSAQAGKKIDSAEASALIEAAESAIDSID